jgi:CRP-like cAMP-binding protein
VTEHFQALRRLSALAAVSDEGVSWLADRVRPQTFEPGECFIVQGEWSRECHFIVDGHAEVSRGGVVLGTSGPGEPEGELGLFLRLPRRATTKALTAVSTLVLMPDDWDELTETQPLLAEEIRTGVCRHLAERFGLPSFAGVDREP